MKSQRQAKILEIISRKDIDTQESLLEELKNEGYSTTQATISRDVKELRIIKEQTGMGTYRYTAEAGKLSGGFTDRLNTIFRECITHVDYAQNILVIRTMPGLANAAASALDTMQATSVVGTLAGDDTVFVVMRDCNAAAVLCGEIESLLK